MALGKKGRFLDEKQEGKHVLSPRACWLIHLLSSLES